MTEPLLPTNLGSAYLAWAIVSQIKPELLAGSTQNEIIHKLITSKDDMLHKTAEVMHKSATSRQFYELVMRRSARSSPQRVMADNCIEAANALFTSPKNEMCKELRRALQWHLPQGPLH